MNESTQREFCQQRDPACWVLFLPEHGHQTLGRSLPCTVLHCAGLDWRDVPDVVGGPREADRGGGSPVSVARRSEFDLMTGEVDDLRRDCRRCICICVCCAMFDLAAVASACCALCCTQAGDWPPSPKAGRGSPVCLLGWISGQAQLGCELIRARERTRQRKPLTIAPN